MTKKREWRLAAFAAFLCAATIVVSGAQAQGSGTPTGGTNCYVNGQWVFYPSGGCPPGGGGGTTITTRQEANDYSHYVSAYNRAMKLYKQGVPADAARAISLCQSALSFIDEALQYEPGDGDAQNLRRQITACISSGNGTLAVQRGDVDQGISYYRQAESEYPESNNIWEKNIAWAESKRQQAIAGQQQAQIDALWAQGKQLSKNEDYKGAEAIWRQVIALDPQNSSAYYNLGMSLIYQDRYTDAEAVFRKAIELNPRYAHAQLELGITLEALQRYAEAVASLQLATQLDPENSEAEYRLGYVLMDEVRFAEAEAAFRKSIELNPNDYDTQYALGELLVRQKRYAEAETALRQAIQLNPKDPLYERQLGYALWGQNRFTESEAAYRKALELSPGDADIQNALQSVIDLEAKVRKQELASQQGSNVPTGAAATVSGPVFWVTSDGQEIPIESGKPVFFNQHVITREGGHLQVLLVDGTVFTMGPNSNMVLDDFVYDPASDQHTIMARITKGVFRFVTGKTARKDPASMKVTLPEGTIGPRGTDFEATVLEDGSGDVKLYSGQLEISETKTGRIFLMNAGETVTFGIDGIFSPLKKMQ
jgi:tetratricopeptide (TPR) repeat protein